MIAMTMKIGNWISETYAFWIAVTADVQASRRMAEKAYGHYIE